MNSLTVERITTLGGLEALQAPWQALSGRSHLTMPFPTWEWHVAWWSHLKHDTRWMADELFVLALRTREGELVAVAPMMLTRRPGSGPLSVRALDFIGPDPNITELRGLACDPAWEARAHGALHAYLLRHGSEWDWIHWRGVRVGSEAHQALLASPDVEPVTTGDMWLLPLPPTWEALKSSRSRNLKESLRKCYNSLKRDGHAFTLRVASTPLEVAPAVDRLVALHAARASLTDTVAHRDVFDAPEAHDFLDDVCQRFARRGDVRVFELVIGGEVVASRIGFKLGDTLYLYYSGFLPSWGDYSVMTTCVAEAIQYAIGQGWKTVNLSTGTDVSKTRWSPEPLRHAELVELAPSLRGRYAYPAYQEVRRQLARPSWKAAVGRLVGRAAPRT